MSIYEVRSRLTHKWFGRKSKDELIRIIWSNIDKINIFADEFRTEMEQQIASKDAEIDALKAENAELKALAEASERWRLAYQDGKMKLYEMGGEIAEAALEFLPCNEGGLDRLSHKVFLYPHFEQWKTETEALKAENTSLREQVSRLSAQVSELKRHAWFDDFRPIINAIGEISVQEAMDAIERDLE